MDEDRNLSVTDLKSRFENLSSTDLSQSLSVKKAPPPKPKKTLSVHSDGGSKQQFEAKTDAAIVGINPPGQTATGYPEAFESCGEANAGSVQLDRSVSSGTEEAEMQRLRPPKPLKRLGTSPLPLSSDLETSVPAGGELRPGKTEETPSESRPQSVEQRPGTPDASAQPPGADTKVKPVRGPKPVLNSQGVSLTSLDAHPMGGRSTAPDVSSAATSSFGVESQDGVSDSVGAGSQDIVGHLVGEERTEQAEGGKVKASAVGLVGVDGTPQASDTQGPALLPTTAPTRQKPPRPERHFVSTEASNVAAGGVGAVKPKPPVPLRKPGEREIRGKSDVGEELTGFQSVSPELPGRVFTETGGVRGVDPTSSVSGSNLGSGIVSVSGSVSDPSIVSSPAPAHLKPTDIEKSAPPERPERLKNTSTSPNVPIQPSSGHHGIPPPRPPRETPNPSKENSLKEGSHSIEESSPPPRPPRETSHATRPEMASSTTPLSKEGRSPPPRPDREPGASHSSRKDSSPPPRPPRDHGIPPVRPARKPSTLGGGSNAPGTSHLGPVLVEEPDQVDVGVDRRDHPAGLSFQGDGKTSAILGSAHALAVTVSSEPSQSVTASSTTMATPHVHSRRQPEIPHDTSTPVLPPRPRAQTESDAESTTSSLLHRSATLNKRQSGTAPPLPQRPHRAATLSVARPVSHVRESGEYFDDDDDDDDDDEDDDSYGGSGVDASPETTSDPHELPDSTFANRRPPHLSNTHPSTLMMDKFQAFALSDRTLVTGHNSLHVFDLEELLEKGKGSKHRRRGSSAAKDLNTPYATQDVFTLVGPSPLNSNPLEATPQGYSGLGVSPTPPKPLVVRNSPAVHGLHGDVNRRITALAFRASEADSAPQRGARFAWAGTRDGDLIEIDTITSEVSATRHAHSQAVSVIFRVGYAMASVDEGGTCLVWGTVDAPVPQMLTGGSPRVIKAAADRGSYSACVGTELWVVRSAGAAGLAPGAAAPWRLRRYALFGNISESTDADSGAPSTKHLAMVTSHAIVPEQPQNVYFGHENGFVSVWNRATLTCVATRRVSKARITCMAGVANETLWVGFRSGFIEVYDVRSEVRGQSRGEGLGEGLGEVSGERPAVPPPPHPCFHVLKTWRAHRDTVLSISVNPAALWTTGALHVISWGSEMTLSLWDGLLRRDWIERELESCEAQFCTYRPLRVLCVTWNVGASKPASLAGSRGAFLHEALAACPDADIVSFGLQEVIDLESRKMTAKTMFLRKKNDLSDHVSSAYRAWLETFRTALARGPASYTPVHSSDMVGLFSCVFARGSLAPLLRDVAHTSVKTGMGGRFGNKGGIISRFVVDDTSICLVNAHLAAGHAHVLQRNSDLIDIMEEKSAFPASAAPLGAYRPGANGTGVFDHEICIVSGDLNYRIDANRSLVMKCLAEHNLAPLLALDQLTANLKKVNSTFKLRSFKEPPILFNPTYKYDPYSDRYDTSSKQRVPAWCDRILYTPPDKVTPLYYTRFECDISDHRPVTAAFDIKVKRIVPELLEQVEEDVISRGFVSESKIVIRIKEFYSKLYI